MRGGRVVQRHLLPLGELNDSQRAGWVRTIETLTSDDETARQLALFPDDRDELPELGCAAVRIRVAERQLRRPRQCGACWLALDLWSLLGLDEFWGSRLPPSRKRTRWANVLQALAAPWERFAEQGLEGVEEPRWRVFFFNAEGGGWGRFNTSWERSSTSHSTVSPRENCIA